MRLDSGHGRQWFPGSDSARLRFHESEYQLIIRPRRNCKIYKRHLLIVFICTSTRPQGLWSNGAHYCTFRFGNRKSWSCYAKVAVNGICREERWAWSSVQHVVQITSTTWISNEKRDRQYVCLHCWNSYVKRHSKFHCFEVCKLVFTAVRFWNFW